MRIPRIYTTQALRPEGQVTLQGTAARHLSQVLRLQNGAQVLLFNGDGRDFSASIQGSDKSTVRLQVHSAGPEEAVAPLAITLLQAIGKGERMDYALQKAVELGVQRVVPLFTERTIVRLNPERLGRRMDHWRQVMIGACEQSGRRRLPTLGSAQRLTPELLGQYPGLRLLLAPEGEATLTQLSPPKTQVVLLIGPEGGLSREEIAQAKSADFTALRLGPRILRTETAPLAVIAALQTLWGDFGCV